MKKDDSILEPIHDISLEVYASISYYLAADVAPGILFSKIGIDKAQWNEVDRGWRRRMDADDSFVLITRYSQYYNEAEKYLGIRELKES